MARPKGSKVVPCPKKKCKGKIVAMPGKVGVCGTCGEKVKFTKELLKK
jgi:hypothetical protein